MEKQLDNRNLESYAEKPKENGAGVPKLAGFEAPNVNGAGSEGDVVVVLGLKLKVDEVAAAGVLMVDLKLKVEEAGGDETELLLTTELKIGFDASTEDETPKLNF